MAVIKLLFVFFLASANAFTMRGPIRSAASVQRHQVQNAISMQDVVVIGVAADSGCGKSTFMRRVTAMFGGKTKLLDIGRETNTLVSDTTTVICLDDYHKYDRQGRAENDITALDKDCQDWEKMYEDIKALKGGKSVMKPIYNHITGALDEPEEIKPTQIVIVEGLHPMLDDRVRDLLDFTVYLDISDEIKFAWKVKRDMEERGWTKEQVLQSIEGRKADFAEFVEPQKALADMVISVLPTDLVPDDDEGKFLKVQMIQKEGIENFKPTYLFDEMSSVTWIPCGSKLTCSFPGVQFKYGPDSYLGNEVTIVEMDGKFDKPEELVYIEGHLSNTGAKYVGEMCEQMVANKDAPGSDNGTGLFQTLCAFKIREVAESLLEAKEAVAA